MKCVNKFSVVLIAAILASCSKPFTFTDHEKQNPNTPHQDESIIDELIEDTDPPIDWSEIQSLKQKSLIKLQLEENDALVIEDVTLFSKNLLPRLYKYNRGQFIWDSESNINDAYRALELSYMDGLLPSDYHQAKLEELKLKIEESEVVEERQSLLAKHDILLTDAMIMFGFHLLVGKVDPASIDPDWNYDNRTISKKTIRSFLKLIKDQKVFDGLDRLRPKSASYRAMMNAVHYYNGMSEIDWPLIDGFDKLERGDTNDMVPLIRDRLELCCTGNETVIDSFVFDSTLLQDIVNFQRQHGLAEDGVIGKGTLELLNFTPEQRLDRLKVNLERLRWLGELDNKNAIAVNIAAFKLYVLEEGELIYECNVMTGKPYHKTPVFTEKLQRIEFNPTWTVPYSIATKELLPKLKQEGVAYLNRNNMILLNRKGKTVDAGSVDFNALSRSNFPYIIRQKAGPKNALGEVKFLFPNPYSVYLHDTQSKSLFSKSSRAFSHGCIRVQDPLKLAEVLLSDKKKWDRQKIDKTIEKKKTVSVSIKRYIDVMLLYYTAGLFPDGTLFYLPDIYDRDQNLLTALERPFEYNENTLERVYPERDVTAVDSIMNL